MAAGAAMSSSPFRRLGNGDEDVASPFYAGSMKRRVGARGLQRSFRELATGNW
jgi:hypothetical protein